MKLAKISLDLEVLKECFLGSVGSTQFQVYVWLEKEM